VRPTLKKGLCETLSMRCEACGEEIIGRICWHHVSYDPEKKVPLHLSCHRKVHTSSDFRPDLRPIDRGIGALNLCPKCGKLGKMGMHIIRHKNLHCDDAVVIYTVYRHYGYTAEGARVSVECRIRTSPYKVKNHEGMGHPLTILDKIKVEDILVENFGMLTARRQDRL